MCALIDQCSARAALFRSRARAGEKKANNPDAHSSGSAAAKTVHDGSLFFALAPPQQSGAVAAAAAQQPEFSDNRTNERGSDSQCTLSRTHTQLARFF